MKKIFVILVSVILAAAFAAGCQATPEEEVVIQKDMEQLIEKAVAEDNTQKDISLREYLDAPEIYTASFDGYNGDLTVNANAIVTIPDSNGISVVRAGKHTFTQEEADKMIGVLLQGATLYEIDQSLTKEEIEAKLITYYGMRDGSIPMNVDGENPNDTEKLQQVIEYYENMLVDAPETKNQTPANTKFHTPETAVNPDARVIEGMATVDGKAAYLYINNGFFNANNIEATFVNAQTQPEGNFRYAPYTILSAEDAAKVQAPASFIMTGAEAQGVAEEVLAQLGITEMACVETRFAVMMDEHAGGNVVAEADADKEAALSPEQLANGKWAYSLQYQRTIDGIPVTLTKHDGNSSKDEDDYSEPWPYERVEVIVDETGVVYFHYMSPYIIQETVTENATLRDFPEITSVFEKMFPITYGYLDEAGTDYSLQVEMTEVRLGLMRVTEQNSRDSGLLIPVWDFFGEVTIVPYEGEPYNLSGGLDSLLTLNAIDGAIIDRSLGY